MSTENSKTFKDQDDAAQLLRMLREYMEKEREASVRGCGCPCPNCGWPRPRGKFPGPPNEDRSKSSV